MNTAYRVWDGEQMHYWDDPGLSLEIKGDIWILWREEGRGCRVSIAESHEEGTALMWGIGLKDKNIREIYEGDVREDRRGDILTVVYENDFASFVAKYNNRGRVPLDIWGVDSEFLGDVYQNPELLEVAE
ncbi:YopX family protein [Bacillus subtilis]|uniref:YopX family protein n=1 Tax=Bacillus subtilis TaxID=1423 RepID=UPI0021B1201A|nr:YopX family protein [Bacillus subtilis]MCT6514779.1 YopX family protein [Bacillus subtilis]MCX4075363.1 YopX family protein [Bacillus subtilis]MEC0395544.1 YopX family protein [Bacillus subtilis]MEC0434548.1 YopX family protein [Bacillus subtilis]WRS92244.1 YopX family protein [Bacillus subtilis]